MSVTESASKDIVLGDDKTIDYYVFNEDRSAIVDITGWGLSWLLKRRLADDDDDALIEKTTVSGITITGAFNADEDVNTQKAVVSLSDDDTVDLEAGLVHASLKRTGAGVESTIKEETFLLVRGGHRS